MTDATATTSSVTVEETSSLENQGMAVLVVAGRTEKDVAITEMQEWRKYFWGVGNLPYLIQGARNPIFAYEAALEQIGFPGDAVTSTSPWPDLWRSVELEPRPWRGVFTFSHKHKVLFSKTLSFRISELPRLKPHVVIDHRTQEIENE
jgi:hypothetical protein